MIVPWRVYPGKPAGLPLKDRPFHPKGNESLFSPLRGEMIQFDLKPPTRQSLIFRGDLLVLGWVKWFLMAAF